jgi:hypothetical protein
VIVISRDHDPLWPALAYIEVATESKFPESYAAKVGTFPCFASVAAVALAFRNHYHRRHRYLLQRRRAIH